MLRLTKKADYGLMALKYLAEHPETPSVSAKDIADTYGIPAQLLAKVLQRLAKVGLLRSHAGMNGGYALSKSASHHYRLRSDPRHRRAAFHHQSAPKATKSCESGAQLHGEGAPGACK